MGRPQPDKRTAVLTAALVMAVVICRALQLRSAPAWILKINYGLTALLAIAYLICVFFIRNHKPADTEQKGEGHGQ